MASVENLPPDQLAVLQMVLVRGQSYEAIATRLGIDREAVRRRALDALDALTPLAVAPGPERALVADYLLGQLPAMVADQVETYLAVADADREWGRALAVILEPLTTAMLPLIGGGAPLGATSDPTDDPQSGPQPPTDDPQPPAGDPPPTHREPPPAVRRRGFGIGAAAVGVITVLAVAAVVVVVGLGGASAGHRTAHRTVPPTTVTHTTTSATTTQSAPATHRGVLTLHLSSPNGAAATVGVAKIARHGTGFGIVIAARGVPANTTHNAYAVWLAGASGRVQLVGWVQKLIGASGRLSVDGRLPPDARAFDQVLVALQTQANPTVPGQIILRGRFASRSL